MYRVGDDNREEPHIRPDLFQDGSRGLFELRRIARPDHDTNTLFRERKRGSAPQALARGKDESGFARETEVP